MFGVFAFLFLSLVFTRNFCDEICFTKNNKLSCLSCCSVLLQHVCCFGFILYPPRSPQEVWRVWWVASCFWVRESGMQWCELQCFSILLLCFWSMNGLTSEYRDSCARELGAKRLCLQMPWEQSHANTVLGGKPKPLIPVPDWVDFLCNYLTMLLQFRGLQGWTGSTQNCICQKFHGWHQKTRGSTLHFSVGRSLSLTARAILTLGSF